MTPPLMQVPSLLTAAYLQLAGGLFFFFNVFRIINKLTTGYYITMATWQLARKKQVAQLPWGLGGTKVIVDFFLCWPLPGLFVFLLISSSFLLRLALIPPSSH